MKNIKFTVIIAALLMTSCEKDLDIENPNEAVVEAFWNNADDAVSGVNAAYSTLHRNGISRWIPFYYIIRSDVGKSTSPATHMVNNMDAFQVTDYNYGSAYEIWNDLYVGIFRANQAITNIPNIEMDETQRERMVGEAKFLRAFFYYHLAVLWGNVPIILEPSTPNLMPSTSPRAAVWAQIESDLIDAAEGLPPQYTNSSDVGRATEGAARTLLAKVYMQQQKYEEALEPLHWMIEGEGAQIYDLVEDYRENFLITTENNIESVFEIQFAENPTENTGDDTNPNHNYGTSIAQFFGPTGIGWSDGEARRWVVEEFLEEETESAERDPRLPATFIFDFMDVRGPEYTMVYGETFAERYGPDNTRVWFRKFLNDHWNDVESYRSANNWRFLRYGGVLLLYAEALNATGNTAEAYQYVDRVRERVGLAPLSETKPGLNQREFLAQLKHERLTELAGEGHRWTDLVRWDDFGNPELVERDPAFANFVVGKDELLPIPTQEIDINPNLEQNEGWR